MAEISKMIRQKSKDEDPAKRIALAHELKEGRQEYYAERKKLTEQKATLETAIAAFKLKHSELVSEKWNLEIKQKIEKESLKGKIIKLLTRNEIYHDRLAALKKMNDPIWEQYYAFKKQYEQCIQELAALIKPGRELTQYYKELGQDFLTPEQKKELFTEEILSQLSLDDYIKLWRAGSPHFVSHVTRQGVRDHSATMNHSAGMGVFHHGFEGMVEGDHKLRTPFEVMGLGSEMTEEQVGKVIEQYGIIKDARSKDQALGWWANMTRYMLAAAPTYPDKTAVHLGVEKVLDQLYGAEKGNEIFVIFPSDFVSSQFSYAFNGREKTFRHTQSEDKWNDLFVWPEFGDGISINAGVVFLPKSTMVDRETGSKYATTLANDASKNREPIIESEVNGKRTYSLSQDTITAQEYWENYFQKNPDKKPAHIVYYDGNPSAAADNFLYFNGILARQDHDDLLGQTDNFVLDMERDPRANKNKEHFNQVGLKIIDDHFRKFEPVAPPAPLQPFPRTPGSFLIN